MASMPPGPPQDGGVLAQRMRLAAQRQRARPGAPRPGQLQRPRPPMPPRGGMPQNGGFMPPNVPRPPVFGRGVPGMGMPKPGGPDSMGAFLPEAMVGGNMPSDPVSKPLPTGGWGGNMPPVPTGGPDTVHNAPWIAQPVDPNMAYTNRAPVSGNVFGRNIFGGFGG